MHNCENDKYYHQMRNKYFQFQRNEQSEIVSELHQCFWGGLSEVWEKTKITLCFTHIQEGWQEFSRKLVTSKIYFEAVTFPAAALRGSPHSSHNQLLLWDEQACLARWGEGHEEPSSAGGWQPCSDCGEVLLRGCPLLGMLGKRIQWATCVGGRGMQSYRWCLILTISTFAFVLDDVFEDHVKPRREGGRCLVLLKARPRWRGGGGRSGTEILLRRQRGRLSIWSKSTEGRHDQLQIPRKSLLTWQNFKNDDKIANWSVHHWLYVNWMGGEKERWEESQLLLSFASELSQSAGAAEKQEED